MDILRQTARIVINPVMIDNFAFLFNCGESVLRLNDGSRHILFQKIAT